MTIPTLEEIVAAIEAESGTTTASFTELRELLNTLARSGWGMNHGCATGILLGLRIAEARAKK